MFLLPAILVVVPMLSCAGPLGSLYYDYYDLMGKSPPSIYRGIFSPKNSGKTRHSSPITAGYRASFVDLQPEQSLSYLRFVLFSIWWPPLSDSVQWRKSASPGWLWLPQCIYAVRLSLHSHCYDGCAAVHVTSTSSSWCHDYTHIPKRDVVRPAHMYNAILSALLHTQHTTHTTHTHICIYIYIKGTVVLALSPLLLLSCHHMSVKASSRFDVSSANEYHTERLIFQNNVCNIT